MNARRRAARATGQGVLAALALLMVLAAPSAFANPLVGQFQISQVGTDSDASRSADNPAAAFNPATGQALVVWASDDQQDDKFEIFGRLITSDGVPLGGEFRIGTAGPPGDPNWDAYDARVAYNSMRNEFLVIWTSEEEPIDADFEIRGQRVSATGTLVGGSSRLSDMGPGNASFNAYEPQLTYNPARDEFVVVWFGTDDGLPGRTEVWARRVSGAGVAQGADIRISTLRHAGAWPTIAYNSQANEYLIAFIGQDAESDPASQRIFVQRMTADVAPVGVNRLIFQAGETHKPAVAYNSRRNEYLVAISARVGNEGEAYVQRLDAGGVEIGGDQRISHMGPDEAPDYGLQFDVAVGYSSVSDQYLVTWTGDTTSFGLVKDENEVFGQGLDGAGAEIGLDDQVYSTLGPDGTAQFGVGEHQMTGPLAYLAAGDRFLVVYHGDNGPPLADNEVEVYGTLVGTTPPPVPPLVTPPAVPGPGTVPLSTMPDFLPVFTTRERGRRGVKGTLYGVSGFGGLPNFSIVTVRCEKGCKMRAKSFTVRTRGSVRRTSLKLKKLVRISKGSRVRVTARHAGYISRYIRVKFIRTGLGIVPRRVGHGCQTPSKPARNIRCG